MCTVPICLATLQKRDQAKQQLAELQRGVADNEGPLKERQAALRRLEAQRSALLAEIKVGGSEVQTARYEHKTCIVFLQTHE